MHDVDHSLASSIRPGRGALLLLVLLLDACGHDQQDTAVVSPGGSNASPGISQMTGVGMTAETQATGPGVSGTTTDLSMGDMGPTAGTRAGSSPNGAAGGEPGVSIAGDEASTAGVGGSSTNPGNDPSIGGNASSGSNADTGRDAGGQASPVGGVMQSQGNAGSGGGGSQGTQTDEEGASSIALDPGLLDNCSGMSPIRCQIPVEDGNYTVSVSTGAGTSRVQAELYRTVWVNPDQAEHQFMFTVNVRPAKHDGYSSPGGVLDLLVEGDSPSLVGVGVMAAPDIPTVFIAGDSTVCDWDPSAPNVSREDQRGWAQALTQYFKPGVAIANYADSGETAGSFYGKFFGPARDAMRAGDYLFIQFGHNDQKSQSDIDNYKSNLMRYIDDARARDVTPILFTPVGRKSASLGNPGFAGLDDQARELASDEGVELVDLTALSIKYYATVANKDDLFTDGTHFSELGASGIANVVAGAIADTDLPLAELVR